MEMLSIGQIARRAGVGVETVRFYEREGLLEEPPRRASGYRQYDEQVVKRLHFIKRAQKLGFSLKEIRNYYCCAWTDRPPVKRSKGALRRKSLRWSENWSSYSACDKPCSRWPPFAPEKDLQVPVPCLMRSTSKRRLIRLLVEKREQLEPTPRGGRFLCHCKRNSADLPSDGR